MHEREDERAADDRDADRRVPVDEKRDTPTESPESDAVGDALEDVDFPAGREREACSVAVYAARDSLCEHGPATMREIVPEVLPEHPLEYDVDGTLESVKGATAIERPSGAEW